MQHGNSVLRGAGLPASPDARYVEGMSKAAGSLVLSVLLLSCGFPKAGPAPGPVQPSSASAAEQRWPGTTAAQLERGRATFVAKCNGCHDYPDVRAVPESRWPEIVTKMSSKANLTADQSTPLLRFILVARDAG